MVCFLFFVLKRILSDNSGHDGDCSGHDGDGSDYDGDSTW